MQAVRILEKYLIANNWQFPDVASIVDGGVAALY
jgi:hypothetical protein